MDAVTKIFIVMVLVALIVGIVVIFTHPEYRVKNIYESNKSYYPQITEENIQRDIKQLFSKNK